MVVDLVDQVSGSTIVCVGLAIGTVVSKFRASLMGLLGLLSAPLAFGVSSFPSPGSGPVACHLGDRFWPWPVPVHTRHPQGGRVRVPRSCARLDRGSRLGGALAHVAVGLVVGIFFGGAIVAATYWTSPKSPTSADLVVRGFNELLFPVGCSLVLLSAQALGRD